MKITLLFTAVLILLLTGCSPQENAEQLKAVNYSLENANSSIREEINSACQDLSMQRMDPGIAELAETWLPRSNWIRRKADSISMLIKNIKLQVIKETDSLRNDHVTTHLHDVNGVGYQLLEKIIGFKDSIPEVVTTMDVLKETPLLPDYIDSLSEGQRAKYKMQWVHKNFGSNSSSMAMVMLSKIENDLLITEQKLVKYCNMHVGYGCVLRYEKFESFALLSSSYIKKGQAIKVRAGVGAFTNVAKPKIFIDGKAMPLIGPTVAYEFKPSGDPCKHTISVKFEYYSPDGIIESKTEKLEYIIADEK